MGLLYGGIPFAIGCVIILFTLDFAASAQRTGPIVAGMLVGAAFCLVGLYFFWRTEFRPYMG